MKISSFTGANFTGFVGQSFRFQALDDDGEAAGSVLSGRVKRIFRQGRKTCVEIYIPAKKCTHVHEAKRIYFRGYSRLDTKGAAEKMEENHEREGVH